MARIIVKKAPKKQSTAVFLEKLHAMAESAASKKAQDIKAYDVRGLTVIADAFLLCNATSEPQMKAVFNAIKEDLKELGVSPFNTEGTYKDGWLLMDYADIIVHIFRPQSREFYDLDGLWGDAPVIDLKLKP